MNRDAFQIHQWACEVVRAKWESLCCRLQMLSDCFLSPLNDETRDLLNQYLPEGSYLLATERYTWPRNGYPGESRSPVIRLWTCNIVAFLHQWRCNQPISFCRHSSFPRILLPKDLFQNTVEGEDFSQGCPLKPLHSCQGTPVPTPK